MDRHFGDLSRDVGHHRNDGKTGAGPPGIVILQIAHAWMDDNASERRVTALRNHTPIVVVFALVGTAVLAIGFTAYASGLGGSTRRIGMPCCRSCSQP